MNIHNFAILIHGPPEVMLLAVDLYEYFVDVEGITVSTMSTFQSSGIERAELDTPQTDCFAADVNTSLGEKIFNIAMAEVEAIVEPDGVGDDIWRESVTFISIHPPTLPIWPS
jgi:hypothetical protein